MIRRTFLALASAALLMPQAATAKEFVEYTPGAIEAALKEGKTVLVDYSAKWCSTCARQARVINALRAENPAYDEAMVFFKVDWDTYKNDDVTVFRNIPRRSTLLVLRGEAELGRIVAGTARGQIKTLLDKGLATNS